MSLASLSHDSAADLAGFAILSPWIVGEAISIEAAAQIASVSHDTMRRWADSKRIGRRVAAGAWKVSRPALLMLLGGDETALRQYWSGDRSDPLVRSYFQRCGL